MPLSRSQRELVENSCGCRTGTPVVIRETSTPASLKHDPKLSRKLFASVVCALLSSASG
jgi:hypothetical protein